MPHGGHSVLTQGSSRTLKSMWETWETKDEAQVRSSAVLLDDGGTTSRRTRHQLGASNS